MKQYSINSKHRVRLGNTPFILTEFSRQAWLDGFQSVRYADLSGTSETATYFPLWLVTYWNSMLDIKKKNILQWIKSRDWVTVQLKQRKSNRRREQAETAIIMLSMRSSFSWG